MLMHELDSDDDSITKERVMIWYRELQEHVRNMTEENKELRNEISEMKESAARKQVTYLHVPRSRTMRGT